MFLLNNYKNQITIKSVLLSLNHRWITTATQFTCIMLMNSWMSSEVWFRSSNSYFVFYISII